MEIRKRETARVSMPIDLFERLKDKAKKDMASMSQIIRQAIKKYLDGI